MSTVVGQGLLGVERRRLLHRRVRLVVGVVIGYNVVEAVVALAAGRAASSSALISFGLDSIVEVLSGTAIAWQFATADPRRRERVALRVVAIAFFALAGYVGVAAVRALLGGGRAEPSVVGITLAAISLVVMPALSWIERRTGRELGSASVVADSKQTLICTALSAVLLLGLVANSAFGWAWADPVVALVVAMAAVREGVKAWRGDPCCAGPIRDTSDDQAQAEHPSGATGCCGVNSCSCC